MSSLRFTVKKIDNYIELHFPKVINHNYKVPVSAGSESVMGLMQTWIQSSKQY